MWLPFFCGTASLTHKGQQDGQQHGEGADAGDEHQQEEAQQTSGHQLLRAALAHATLGSQDLMGDMRQGSNITQQLGAGVKFCISAVLSEKRCS